MTTLVSNIAGNEIGGAATLERRGHRMVPHGPLSSGGTLQSGDTDIGAKQRSASSQGEETDVTARELTEELETE